MDHVVAFEKLYRIGEAQNPGPYGGGLPVPRNVVRCGRGGVLGAMRRAVMRRSPRKASLFLAVMTLWLRVGLPGLRRGAAPTLIVSFPKQTYRIGEAANPGPFS